MIITQIAGTELNPTPFKFSKGKFLDTRDLSRVLELQFPSFWSFNNSEMLLQSFGMSLQLWDSNNHWPFALTASPSCLQGQLWEHLESQGSFSGSTQVHPSLFPSVLCLDFCWIFFLPGFLMLPCCHLSCHFQRSFTFIFISRSKFPAARSHLLSKAAGGTCQEKKALIPMQSRQPAAWNHKSYRLEKTSKTNESHHSPSTATTNPCAHVPHAHGLGTFPRTMNLPLPWQHHHLLESPAPLNSITSLVEPALPTAAAMFSLSLEPAPEVAREQLALDAHH